MRGTCLEVISFESHEQRGNDLHRTKWCTQPRKTPPWRHLRQRNRKNQSCQLVTDVSKRNERKAPEDQTDEANVIKMY